MKRPLGEGESRLPTSQGEKAAVPEGALSPNLFLPRDALDACAALPSNVQFDLVYLDPPYGVGTTMSAREERGQRRGRRTAESGPDAYDDKLGTDALVKMLAPRLDAIRLRMSAGATLYLHLDYRAVHEMKVAADAVFGRGAFLGEVIWAPGNGSRGARGFSVTHQTLLLYVRAAGERKQVVYNSRNPDLREPFADTSLAMHFKNVDEDGRRYRERVVGGKTYRYYADEGRRLGSVWTDIPAMVANTPLRREGTGYPTQKPERLLERIIGASSAAGATVADLMCGSGTTLIAAARLGRRFVGADKGSIAATITTRRLTEANVPFEIFPPGAEAEWR